MPYAKNGGTKIYYEVEGGGPPLVMLHGLTAGLDGWKESGFVDALKDEYQVVLMDFRGHGKSDKPHDPAGYTAGNVVGDVAAVMDKLGIKCAGFMGYSYGGGICFELARYVPERTRCIIVGGAGARLPSPEMTESQIKFFESGKDNIIAVYEQNGTLPPNVKSRMLANDYAAIAAACKAMLSYVPLLDDVPKMKMPFLIYCGEADFAYAGARETSRLLPDVTFISLPGLDHIQAGSCPGLIVPRIKQFLARVS